MSKSSKTISQNPYRFLLGRYLRPQGRPALLLSLLVIAGIALQLANPQLVRRFLDGVESGQELSELVKTALLFTAIALLAQGLKVLHNPIYMEVDLPDLAFTSKTAEHRLETLEVRDLTYRYPHAKGHAPINGGSNGVTGINFTLQRGSFTVISGRIGSGKTTLLKSLLGLLPAQEGQIFWNGRAVADLAHFMVPPRAAHAAQVPQLFSDTLRHNILLGYPGQERELDATLRSAVFEKDVAAMDLGLDTPVGPRGVRLSGGQIQRTAAARMFVRDAELLLFDDLSSALDVETELQLWERLFADDEGSVTCLVVSHRRAALRRADKIILLKDGQVLDEGSLEELLIRSEEMQRLWQSE